jgi:hypothetical protein
MLRNVKTFNGNLINDGTNFRATILNPRSLPPAQPVFLAQAEADSVDAGAFTVEPHMIAVDIKVLNYGNRIALIAQLQRWFKRGTQGDLVVTYKDDGLDYFKPCRVVNLIQDPEYPTNFKALLNTGWTTWRAVQADTYDWALTGTGGSHTVTLLGDDETPLSVTFNLSAGPASGYLYQRFYQLINAASPVPALGYGPWCITIDTAALIADNANKCQINQGGGIDATVTTIPYDTVTGSLPNIGSGYVDTEQIRWTGKTGTTSGNLTGVTRGVGGTTAASHLDNAEIKLSTIQANCADLRIFVEGKEVNRWIANPNNASTKVWFNLTMNKGYALPLREAIDSSSNIPFIYFAITPDTFNAVTALPNEGIMLRGTEWIKYRRVATGYYGLQVIQRGILGSTKQAHSIGDVFKFMEHVITVCYGNAGVVEPSTVDVTYNNTKPLFSLTSSDNAAWVYSAATLFCDLTGTGRTGGFTPAIAMRSGEVSGLYFIKRNAASGDPALGMKIGSFLQGTGWVAETAKILYFFYRACGIDTTTFTGEKYRTGTSWPADTGLRKSADGVIFTDAWIEATPGSVATWTALASHSGVAMGGVRWMAFRFSGAYPAGANSYALFEIQTGTINFVSANLPTGTLLSQKVSAQLELTLANAANEDAFDVIRPMLVGLALVMDGEAKTVLYNNVNAHDAVTLNDEGRDHWIRLQTGSNELTITATDVGSLSAALSWYRRRF